MHDHTPLGTQLSIAETLLWQEKFRRALAVLVGFMALSLIWTGPVAAPSVLSSRTGVQQALSVAALAVAAYLLFNAIISRRVAKSGTASRALLYIVLAADVVLLFTVLFAATPPSEYVRGLILATFALPFTRLYFGRRATVVSVAAVALGYTTLIGVATNLGLLDAPQEQFWNLGIFLLGTLLLGELYGEVAGQMDRMLALFERAQEGDFSGAYDESLDRMPDPITMIGRSYNTMRVRLQSLVLTDALSGCFNRRGFDQLCAREVSRAVRGRYPIALLAIDGDQFKRVNDEFGHLTGDEVLRGIGARLRGWRARAMSWPGLAATSSRSLPPTRTPPARRSWPTACKPPFAASRLTVWAASAR